MANTGPPKKLRIEPGESPWVAMARELAANPDSVASLHIMSAVCYAMAPRQRAVDQLVNALQAQLQRAGEMEKAAVVAAIQFWERECGTPMSEGMLEELTKDARVRIEAEQRRPPTMESILELGRPGQVDAGYALGVHLEGLDGTWHRLWAIIALAQSFGNNVAQDEGVAAVRQQFEDLLGRALKKTEWDALVAHSAHRAESMNRQG